MSTTFAKPSMLPCFPPHADPAGDCVLARLLSQAPWRADVPWPEGFAAGISHRLDVPTSGALLVADDMEELAAIRAAFAAKSLVKTYRFRAAKDVPWDDNFCEAAIAHAKRKKGRMVVRRGPNTEHRGKWYPARTEFERVSGNLWAARMRTGVMHQIRVHAAFVGLPLSGDKRYGGGGDGAFALHHVGLTDSKTVETAAVALPEWARESG